MSLMLVRSLAGAPCVGAVQLAAAPIYLVPGDAEFFDLDPPAVVLTGAAAVAAVAVRTDLPLDHPLRGERALVDVPSGSPDLIVTQDGVLVAFEIEGS